MRQGPLIRREHRIAALSGRGAGNQGLAPECKFGSGTAGDEVGATAPSFWRPSTPSPGDRPKGVRSTTGRDEKRRQLPPFYSLPLKAALERLNFCHARHILDSLVPIQSPRNRHQMYSSHSSRVPYPLRARARFKLYSHTGCRYPHP